MGNKMTKDELERARVYNAIRNGRLHDILTGSEYDLICALRTLIKHNRFTDAKYLIRFKGYVG